MIVKIRIIIFLTTLISTTASLMGGLIMYFQSIEALESTVEQISRAETQELALQLNRSVIEPMNLIKGMELFFLTADNIPGNSTYCTGENMKRCAAEWDRVAKWYEFSVISASDIIQEVGVVLLTDEVTDPNFFYTHVWYDILRNGSRDFVHSHYSVNTPGFYIPPENQTETDTAYHLARTNSINTTTGETIAYAYNFSVTHYNGDSFNWTKVANARWRPPVIWPSSDGNQYAFMAYDTAWDPPPPPHPWSFARKVLLQSFFVFETWRHVLAEYSALHHDTTVVVLDMQSKQGYLYGASLGVSWVREICEERRGPMPNEECRHRLADMPGYVQEAVRALNGSSDDFITSSADGEEMFLRILPLFRTTAVLTGSPKTDSQSTDATIIWIRPVSSVSGAVFRALVILILFSIAVLLCDVVLATLEIRLIAGPMMRVANAVEHTGYMHLEEAKRGLDEENNRCLHVREVKQLVDGMCSTLSILREYRTYLPPSLLLRNSMANRPEVPAPEGNVAIVFTDIYGSTNLWDSCPDSMNEAIEIHNRVMRSSMDHFNGYEVKTIGDAFMVAFQDAFNTCKFCLRVQEQLAVEKWPAGLPELDMEGMQGFKSWKGLKVRMGVHWGDVLLESNPTTDRFDYRGPTVNKAARVEGQSLPGMIAITHEMLDQVADVLPQHNIIVCNLGIRVLKGITDPAGLYYILSPALQYRQACFNAALNSVSNPLALPQVRPSMSDRDQGSELSLNSSTISHTLPRPSLKKGPVLHRQLNKHKGGVAEISINCALNAAFADRDPTRVLGLMQSVLKTINEAAGLTNGTMVSVQGGSAIVTWGLSQSCALIDSAIQGIRFCSIFFSKVSRNSASVGLCYGPLLHGNVGTSGRRFNTVLGTTAFIANTLASYASKVFRVPALVVFFPRMDYDNALGHILRPVDIWGVQPGVHIVVHQPLRETLKELVNANVWDTFASTQHDAMESLQNTIREDHEKYRTNFFRAMEGDPDAIAVLEGLAMRENDDVIMRVVEHVKEHVNSSKGPPPSFRVQLPISRGRQNTQTSSLMSIESLSTEAEGEGLWRQRSWGVGHVLNGGKDREGRDDHFETPTDKDGKEVAIPFMSA